MDTKLSRYNESLVVVPDEDAGAQSLLERLTELVVDGDSRIVCSVAIPGGASPRLFFAKTAEAIKARPASWQRAHFFFTDERCVPAEHPDSNFLQASSLLFVPAELEDSSVHRITCEDIPCEAASEYALDIRSTLGHDPRLDMAILGLGPEGHTASLFPGAELHVDKTGMAGWCFVPKLKSWRVTLTAEFLRRSKSIYVIAWGEAKAEVVRRVMQGESEPADLPVLGLRPHRGHLTWLVDEAAASLL